MNSKLLTAAIVAVLIALLTSSTEAAKSCSKRGMGAAVKQTDIVDWCPQWNNKESCCTKASLNTYFTSEKQVCNKKVNFASGTCEYALRGLQCFTLCATDEDVAAYVNNQNQLKVCHKFADEAFNSCRGKLLCPKTNPDGTDNSKAICHTDSSSTSGCMSMGQYATSSVDFTQKEVSTFFGLDLTGKDIGGIPKQEYVKNVEVQDGTKFTCFAAAPGVHFTIASLIVAALIALVIV